MHPVAYRSGVPWTNAAKHIAFIAVALLVAVVDREIEASSGSAPEVVKTGDSGSGVVGDFRRVVVHSAGPSVGTPVRRVHPRLCHGDLIANSNE